MVLHHAGKRMGSTTKTSPEGKAINKHSLEDYLNSIGARLPRTSAGWRAMRCPFHEDKNASAGINIDEGQFKCHACEVHGDVYNLIMYKEGINYIEAVKFAEKISPNGDANLRIKPKQGGGISRNSGSFGRRGSSVPSGGGRRTTAGS